MKRFTPRTALSGAVMATLLSLGCGPTSAPHEPEPLAAQGQRSAYWPRYCAFVDRHHLLECVEINQSPQVPYDAVFNRMGNICGTDMTCRFQPIQMLVPDPEWNATHAELTTWLDSQQNVIAFLKNSNKSAETLKATLTGMRDSTRGLVRSQDRELAAVSNRIKTMIDSAESTVKAKAREYGDPVVVEEAEVKAGMVRVEATVSRARADLDVLVPEVVALANRFAAFKATEPATTASLRTLATQGSAANLQGLVTVQLDAVALAHQESGAASVLAMDAVRLRMQLGRIQEDYVTSLLRDKEFIAQRGLVMGDLVDGELEMLGGIEGYCDSRRRKVLTAVDRLLEGMKQRRDALIGLEADAATRQAMADAAFLTASQRFLDDVTARSTQLWKVAPKSTVLKLSFLSEKFDQMESYLQFEPACAPPAAGQRSWRETGCVAMRRDFSRVRTWMTSTLPGTLRLNVAMMRNAGTVPAAMLLEVEAKLAAGQLKDAATVHDAALRKSDGL
ncbi:hypothetical protein MYSTI_01315 [Myxococcus stipitatus DSM 14675]|uniref:Lipoprotein n=1 Tax=Myxococcus stipitatus (strain DSM 14675 / JCM 12634 / Mx s8) TaxID=1278073 RepID=L7U377_MYXSD|nr:hypothetical protein [Myxococcus stipitatus]AGC42663.1 hypothetical protein MYSTI_01315 [Myxococcus stipitatus DSM 14675]